MNGTRNLIWGIALSLLVHGALLGLPFSPGGQRIIPTYQSIPLEISLVKLKGHGDAPPKTKSVPLTQPQRIKQSVSIIKTKLTKRMGQSPVGVEEKAMPLLREKPITPLNEEKTVTPTPEPISTAPQGKITGNDTQTEGEEAQKAPLASPLPSVKNPAGRENLKASIITKGGDSLGKRYITLARPRYDRNPKPPYPRVARRRGYEGVVVLKVEILPNGRVGELQVKRSSGHHILDRSALKTVKRWKFIPAKRGEDPIRIWAEIPIKFKLE